MNNVEPLADAELEEAPEAAAMASAAGGQFEAAILRLAAERGEGTSFTPAEVALALSDDWRPLLGPIRAAARRLAEQGRIDILRHGKPVAAAAMKGVIRLRLKPA